jgi:hypothetical protein
MAKQVKYTPAMVAVIQSVSDANSGLDLSLCTSIAERAEFVEADISARGIVAKARTMGLPYRKVEKASKTGEPVARKDELVHEIEKALGVTGLDSLSKAEKPALRKLPASLAQPVADVA